MLDQPIIFKAGDEPPALPCHEKLLFPDAEQAQAAAILAEYRYGTKLKIYQCRDCGSWHLSSS